MKLFKKTLAVALALTMTLTYFIKPTTVYALQQYGAILYETRDSQTLTEGVTFQKIRRLYEAGWLDTYTLVCDVKNPNVKLDVIQSTKEFGLKETVLSLAKDNGVVAAVNGDFFGSGNPGSAMGSTIKDGKMTSSNNYYNYEKYQYSSLLMDKNATPFFDFIKTSLAFYNSPTTPAIQVQGKNKVMNFKNAVYFDRNAITTTADLDKRYKNLYKIVVDNKAISYISKAGETVTVPENGYIIVFDETVAKEKLKFYTVGQGCDFPETMTFKSYDYKISDIIFGISGGARIVENGNIVQNGLIIEKNKRNPRTIVGLNKEKTKLIIMAIDGRNESIGATSDEAAKLVMEYGAYDAMHMDGGGSTTMVSRDLGANYLKLTNTPSDGAQRKVPNGIGIKSTAQEGALKGFTFRINSIENHAIFEGVPVDVTAFGYDEHFNPKATENVSFSVTGVDGTFDGNRFTPTTTGEGTIIATLGDVSSEFPVKVYAKPTYLSTLIDTKNIKIGEKVQFTPVLKNADGYSLTILPKEVTWSLDNPVATVDESGTFTGVKGGNAIVTVNYGELSATAELIVGTNDVGITSFEKNEPVGFSVAPNYVTGSASITDQQSYDRTYSNYSLALNYNFKPNISDETQAAYAELGTANLSMSGKPLGIGMWVKGDNSGNLLKGKLKDAENKDVTIQFTSSIDFDDWRYLYAPIPSTTKFPVKLDKIYVAALSTENILPSTIYMDYISASYPLVPLKATTKKQLVDYMRTDLTTVPQPTEFDVTVFGQTVSRTKLIDTSVLTQMVEKMQKNATIAMFTGYTNLEKNKMNITAIKWQDAYKIDYYKSLKIINLATSKGSLRLTDASQWKKIKNDLYATSHKNVVLVTNKNIFDGYSFTDAGESDLLHSTLKKFREDTNSNVIVVMADGTSSAVTVKDGIRYITLNGLSTKSEDLFHNYSLLRLRVDDNNMFYDLQNPFANENIQK